MKIILADDHRIIRDGLYELLRKEDDFEIVAMADNGREAYEKVKEFEPDIVVIDVAMPILNGIEATRKIMALGKKTKVIALSMHNDRRFIDEMFRAGASGYLFKDCAYDELITAIRVVKDQGFYLSSKIMNQVIGDFIKNLSDENNSAFAILTEREREVLQLIAEGNSTSTIAKTLFIGEKTVETHRRNIMSKLNISNVADLTKYAIREGLTFLNI